MRKILIATALSSFVLPIAATAQDIPVTAGGKEALAILEEAIAVPTVKGRGQVPVLAEKLKARLIAAGIAAQDITFTPMGETGYFTARYRGSNSSAKPLVVIAHMDVVEAKPDDWERDPFTPVVEGGFIFGRGSVDNKGDLAMVMAAFTEMKKSGYVPSRDIVLGFSGDEETEMATTQAMAQALKNAALVLNADAGGGELTSDNTPFAYSVQAGEKAYADYTLTVTDPGGHSSRPGKTNAIAAMSRALVKVAEYQFPVQLSPLTKAYLEGSAAQAPADIAPAMRAFAANPADKAAADALSARPEYVGIIRTTCVPTLVNGGHAENALPQSATANVNCRIFPGTSPEEVSTVLQQVMSDPSVAITVDLAGTVASPESPLVPEIMSAVDKAVHARAPALPIVPNMSAGATDSQHFRVLGIPALGVSAIFMRPEDEFSHGLNERLPVATLDPGVAQWVSVLKSLTQ